MIYLRTGTGLIPVNYALIPWVSVEIVCKIYSNEALIMVNNRLFAVGDHVTTAYLSQSAMAKWYPEMERAGWHL